MRVLSSMVGLTRGVRQEVMNSLDFRDTWRWDAPLNKLGEPLPPYPGSLSDFTLGKSTQVYQLICALKQVHCPILEKYYLLCKQNFPDVTCENARTWEDAIRIILPRGWLRLAARHIPS